jgi:hypothetical protein
MVITHLGTIESLRVNEVGYLSWMPKGYRGISQYSAESNQYREKPDSFIGQGLLSDETYVWYPTFKTPDITGFSLELVLDEGLSGDDVETYTRTHHKIDYEPTTEHWTIKGTVPRFPAWLTQFADDIMDWTRADEVRVMEEDTNPGEQSNFIEIAVDYEYVNPTGIDPCIPIKNFDVFIGTAATHLAALKASSE